MLDGGELTSNPLMAETLEQLAVEGPRLFTHGAVAKALVADMAENGGLITAADLTSYEAVVRPVHSTHVGDWHVATNPPPAIGGPMLAIMLGELARRGQWTWADAIEIQRAVLGYRTSVHDHSEDLTTDGQRLLEAVSQRGLERPARRTLDRAHLRGRLGRQRLRDHDEQWVRRRHDDSRDRDPAQQRPR